MCLHTSVFTVLREEKSIVNMVIHTLFSQVTVLALRQGLPVYKSDGPMHLLLLV